ncbi:MAG: lipopolysaccharide transport periplasmic protein LptA [Deltaproteobacteria bacterium]|nr:lipopolysaccharide transport periplasmic protein LptA [Deltaproteobacteria bacterium]
MKTTILNSCISKLTHRGAFKNRTLSACMIIALWAAMTALPPAAHARESSQNYGVGVAVLPFEVFSLGKEPTLGAEVAASIARQLALNPAIISVDSQKIQSVLQPDDYVAMTEDRLRRLAKLLNANYIIMGTITKIRDEHSIDAELFTTASAGPNFKTFSEGLEIQSLIETIVTTLDQEIMEKADRIPAAERPQVSTGRVSPKSTPAGGYDVERELLSTFGPLQEEPRPPSASGSAPADAVADNVSVVPDAPVVPDSPDVSGAADSPASASAAAVMPAETPVSVPAGKKRAAAKDARDSGFFSLAKAISINSDTMEYDNRQNMAIFNGNVVARQDDIVMFANAMHVFYSESGGLSRVEAKGDVRVLQGDRIATGSSIVFDNANQTIVATGSPRVWQGDNVVHGRKITVFLKEERTVVEGEPNSRASATIYPASDKKRP